MNGKIKTFVFISIFHFILYVCLVILHTNQTGSSFRDESVHSAVTQKQSIDSMTLSRCQSFKLQPSNQFKLKSNFPSNNSGTLTECQRQSNIDLSIDHIEDVTMKNCTIPMKKSRSIKSEYAIYDPEMNLNSNSKSFVENRIESAGMLSMPPPPPPSSSPLNIETNANKIRLTMETSNPTTHHVRRTSKPIYYNNLRRSTAQPLIRSWFGWYRPKKNMAFYSPPFEHPAKGVKIQIHTNENPKGVSNKCVANEATVDTSTTAVNFIDNNNISSNDDEDISNSSLQNVDSIDELAAYMDEIRAREKR